MSKVGSYNREFAKKHIRELDKAMGKDGELLNEREARRFHLQGEDMCRPGIPAGKGRWSASVGLGWVVVQAWASKPSSRNARRFFLKLRGCHVAICAEGASSKRHM